MERQVPVLLVVVEMVVQPPFVASVEVVAVVGTVAAPVAVVVLPVEPEEEPAPVAVVVAAVAVAVASLAVDVVASDLTNFAIVDVADAIVAHFDNSVEPTFPFLDSSCDSRVNGSETKS